MTPSLPTVASLHNHGEFSLLESLLRMEDMVRAARVFGMPALGLTDRNSLSGVVSFVKACRATEPQVRPVVGCEVIFEGGFPLVLLAKNNNGYGNLCELLTRQTHEFQPIPWRKLERFAGDLVCLTGGQDAEMPQLLNQGKLPQADALAKRLADLFPGNCYVELTWHKRRDTLSCLRLAELAQRCGLPLVAGANSRYLRPNQDRALQMLGSIRTLSLFEQPSDGKITKETHGSYAFLSPAKFGILFAGYPGALENTVRIAEQCRVKLLES